MSAKLNWLPTDFCLSFGRILFNFYNYFLSFCLSFVWFVFKLIKQIDRKGALFFYLLNN
jgi:hypothetical protein